MLTYPDINPIALQLGPVSIYWYGVMYLLGFLGAYGICYHHRLKTNPTWKPDDIIDLFFYASLGVIFGGTWGYLAFYEPQIFLTDPLRALRFWEPGRSFHGGLVGVLCAILMYCKAQQRQFFAVTDFIAPAIPVGLATGRLGNFINAELWGRVTDAPWAMVFPGAGILPRHPSQLYEFALEGIVLLILLNWYAAKPKPIGTVSGLFLLGYGLMRFIVEFYREPDLHQGFVMLNWLTMGQLLSIPMVVFGLIIFLRR